MPDNDKKHFQSTSSVSCMGTSINCEYYHVWAFMSILSKEVRVVDAPQSRFSPTHGCLWTKALPTCEYS